MPIQNERTIKEALADNEFELPIGYTDKDGNFHKTVILKEMTGLVDEAISDAKIRSNPGKMVTEALHGVTEKLGTMKNVSKDAIRNLTNTDRDFMLVMNHKVSIGDTIEWNETCPSCNSKFDATIDIDKLSIKYMTEDEPKELTLELPRGVEDAEGKLYKKIRVSLPTGAVQERVIPLVQQNPSQAITQLLVQITEDIEGLSHWNFETFQRMTKKDRNYIGKEVNKTEVGVNLNPMVSCASCGHAYESTIPVMTLLGE